MTFAEVERVLGTALPASAYKYRPWWANESGGTHVHAKAWMEAGFSAAEVDLEGRKLVFVQASSAVQRRQGTEGGAGVQRHPLLGLLKGLGKVGPGVDLTAPADPDWGRRAYGDQ
jgi:hypothetical protein